ncbi:hypothetical protein FCV25MIE_15044 [Fagus crenata]
MEDMNGDSFQKVKQRFKDWTMVFNGKSGSNQRDVVETSGLDQGDPVQTGRDSSFGGSRFWRLLLSIRSETPRYSLCILRVLCNVCSSPVDILSVQEMALLSFGKLYNIGNLLYSIIALVHLFIKINWLFRQWGIELC